MKSWSDLDKMFVVLRTPFAIRVWLDTGVPQVKSPRSKKKKRNCCCFVLVLVDHQMQKVEICSLVELIIVENDCHVHHR